MTASGGWGGGWGAGKGGRAKGLGSGWKGWRSSGREPEDYLCDRLGQWAGVMTGVASLCQGLPLHSSAPTLTFASSADTSCSSGQGWDAQGVRKISRVRGKMCSRACPSPACPRELESALMVKKELFAPGLVSRTRMSCPFPPCPAPRLPKSKYACPPPAPHVPKSKCAYSSHAQVQVCLSPPSPLPFLLCELHTFGRISRACTPLPCPGQSAPDPPDPPPQHAPAHSASSLQICSGQSASAPPALGPRRARGQQTTQCAQHRSVLRFRHFTL